MISTEQPFVWGQGGVQMTPERIAAERKVAEALMMQGMDASPVKHWTQGAARVAQGMMGGYDYRRTDQAERANRDADKSLIEGLINGGGSPSLTTTAPSTPTPPSAMPPIVPQGGGAPMSSAPGKIYANDEVSPLDPVMPSVAAGSGPQPRGYRNNNPLNIEAGGFTQGQPGYAGTDGRFAKFGSMDQGVGAANNLLDVYERKHGLNTPAGIISRWAPSSDGNNVSAYAGNVANQLGIDPNTPITPEMRPKLIAAMAQHENGRPMPTSAVQSVATAMQPTALAFNGQPATATDAPMPGATPAQYTAPAQPAAAAPQTGASGPFAGVNPKALAIISSPYASEGAKKIAGMIVAQQMKETGATDETKEYSLYSAQARAAGQPVKSFFDYKSDLKKAGAQNITLDQKGESAFDTTAGQVQAKRFDELAGEAPKAKQMLSDVQILTDLGKNIGTGKTAEIKAVLGPYADALGIKVEGLSDIQAYEAVVNRVAPNLRVPGSGAQSDYELRNFLKALPNLGNTPEGNEIASSVMQGLYQNKINAAEIGAKALSKEITRPQAEKMLRDLPDPMGPYREYMKKNRGAPSASGNKTKTGVTWSVE